MGESLGSATLFLDANSTRLATALAAAEAKVLGRFGVMSSTAGKLMVTGMAVAGAAVAAFAVSSINKYREFEDAMVKSTSIMGDVTDEQYSRMEDAAREVGRTTRFSATEAAEAYFYLASAGMDAEQSIAALPQVAAFAQAGNFDLAQATDLLTDAQSALGLKSDKAAKNLENLTHVSDVLVKANTLANASVEQFSTALTTKAGAAAKNLGKDVEETSAVLAVFADQGVKGQLAGNALNIVWRDMQTAALKNKEAFKEFNVEVYDSQGNMRNTADIVADLEGALAGMTDKQKKATLAQLGFQDRSQAFLLTLLGNSDAMRGYEKELRKAGGTTKEVADKQMRGLNGALELLKGEIEDVQLALGKKLTPIVEDVVRALVDLIRKVREGKGIFGVFGDVIDVVSGPLKTFIPILLGVAAAASVARLAILLMNAAMLLNPYVALAAATIAIVVLIVKKWTEIKKFFKQWWPLLITIITGPIGFIVGMITKHWDKVRDRTKIIWNSIKDFIVKVWNGIKTWISNAIKNVRDFVVNGWQAVKDRTSSIWSSILGFIRSLPGRIIGFLSSLPGRALNIAQRAWSSFRDATTSKVEGILNFVSSIPGKIVNALGDLGGLLYDEGVAVISGFLDGLKAKAEDMFNFVKSIPGKIKSLKGPLPEDLKLLQPEGSAIIEGLTIGMGSELKNLERFASSLAPTIQAEVAASNGGGALSPEVHISFANGMEWLRDFVNVEIRERDRDAHRQMIGGVIAG